jgi:hypothetical protein
MESSRLSFDISNPDFHIVVAETGVPFLPPSQFPPAIPVRLFELAAPEPQRDGGQGQRHDSVDERPEDVGDAVGFLVEDAGAEDGLVQGGLVRKKV